LGADGFLREIARIGEGSQRLSVLLDITTFTREALVSLLGLLRQFLPSGKVTCVYNSAKSYGAAGERVWLSRGVRDIRSVLGFPGEVLPARRFHLVVLVGYEVERPSGLIDAFEPHMLSLGVARRDQSISEEMFRTQQDFLQQLRASRPASQIKEFECSARDPFEAKDAILRHVEACPGFNTVLAPFNTKLSVVGTCLAAMERRDILVCYAQPNAYNLDHYSAPSDDLFLFDVFPS
jgi:hypothetical protein